MSSVRVCGKIDSALDVSGVMHGDFYLSAGHVFESTEGCMLEGAAKEEAKRHVLDDVRLDFERYIAHLQR